MVALPFIEAQSASLQQASTGDILVSTGGGQVLLYSASGDLRQTLQTDLSGELTGSALDKNHNLYVSAGFAGGGVVKFDSMLTFQGPFGSGYQNLPESVAVDSSGNIYVGAAQEGNGGQAVILKLDSQGTFLASYQVDRESRGSDWIDLAADQRTLYYTSEGKRVKCFDLQANRQLPDFSGAGTQLFALRVLADGTVLAANTTNVLLLDPSGHIARTYLDNSESLFALNLDPDGTSFWTAEQHKGDIFRVDIASSDTLQTIHAGTLISGLSIVGEITSSTSSPGDSGALRISDILGVPAAAGIIVWWWRRDQSARRRRDRAEDGFVLRVSGATGTAGRYRALIRSANQDDGRNA